MADLKSITDRIKKLLALSKSPNEHEAANAAAAAARLQAEYFVEQAMLEDEDENFTVEEIAELQMDVGMRKIPSWKAEIRLSVCELNGCRTYSDAKGGSVIFGRRSATNTVLYTCQYLYTEIAAIADREWAKVPLRPESKRTWTHSFRFGCATRIAERIKELLPKRLEGIPERALTIILKHDQEVQDSYKIRSKELGLITVRARTRYHKDAYNQGVAAGNNINLGGQRPALGAMPARISGRSP